MQTAYLPLLPTIDGDASIGALCTAEGAGLCGDENLIGELVHGHAVRIRTGSDIHQPLARSSIDYAEDRPIGHVSSSGVVTVVTRVVPDFVGAPALIDVDLASEAGRAGCAGPVKDDQQRRELDSIMASAADKEIVARALSDASGHAIEGRNDVDHDRPRWISDSGVDFVDATYGDA